MKIKKILVLYFSGVGATKKVAELAAAVLSKEYATALYSIENSEAFRIEEYDALVIGTPTYHAAPARALMNFFAGINSLSRPKPAFIYNTRGLYSCNTNRILAKELRRKNIVTVMDRAYRSPASDISLLLPSLNQGLAKIAFRFDREIQRKAEADCNNFIKLLDSRNPRGYIPRFQFSSILNAPNKFVGQLLTVKIYLHADRCTKCGKCVNNCAYHALSKSISGYPEFKKENCTNCYRCVHHCPQMALSLSKHKKTRKVLKYK